MTRQKFFMMFTTSVLCFSLFSQSAFARDTGYKNVDNVTVEEDGDVYVQLRNVSENNGWFKIYASLMPKNMVTALILTAFSTGREVKLFINSSNRVYKVRTH